MSVLLIVCAGLLIRSFARLQQVDPGVQADHALTFHLSLPGVRYKEEAQQIAFYHRLLPQLEALPGVRAAGATSQLPLTGTSWTGDSTIEGRPPTDYIIEVRHKTVSLDYFDTAGLRIHEGRNFARTDTAETPIVLVVNQALARKYFPNENPIGRRISFSKPSIPSPFHTIVGVVANERQERLNDPVLPEIYQTLAQDAQSDLNIMLRTQADPRALVPAVRETVRALDPTLAVQEVRTVDDLIDASVAPQRFSMLLMSAFAAVALLLAVVGIYGVVSHSVTQRTSEIGVRLALGATSWQITGLVVRQALAPVTVGLIGGLAAAVLATRLLAAQLFEISPTDPLTMGTVVMVLGGVALIASVIPARRALRIDPVNALRAE